MSDPEVANSGIQAAAWKLETSNPGQVPESAIVPDTGNRDMESMIGEDRRELVDPSDLQEGGKYRSIVKIFSKFRNAQNGDTWMMGTGWLVSPNLMVTAGHNVYDWGRNLGAATEVKCYIGYNGRDSINQPGVQARSGQSIVTTAEWVSSSDNRTRDVAFIKLDRPFNGNLRLFNYVDTPPSGEDYLGVVGYPGDRALSHFGSSERGAQAYEESTLVRYDLRRSDRNMIEYNISTFSGQDGGPILQRTGNGFVAIGCNTYAGSYNNAGNSIGGQYGNNYDAFFSLFNSQASAFGTPESISRLNAQAQTD